jgi:hypothetical protein
MEYSQFGCEKFWPELPSRLGKSHTFFTYNVLHRRGGNEGSIPHSLSKTYEEAQLNRAYPAA